MSSRKSLLLEKRNTGTGGRVGIQVDNCSRISSDFLKNVQPWEVTSFGGRPRAPSNFSDHSAHFRMEAAGLGMSDTLTEEFCRNTSLHGLKYIGQRRFHFVEKIFWTLAFAGSVIIAAWMISAVWQKYKRHPVIVSFQPFETKTNEIAFPAITICNMNKILRSKAEAFMRNARGNPKSEEVREAREKVIFMDHVCAATVSFSKRFNYSVARGAIPDSLMNTIQGDKTEVDILDVTEFLDTSSQKCIDMIPLCIWQDEPTNCSDLFTSEATDFGKCCTFNMMPRQLLYRNGYCTNLVCHTNVTLKHRAMSANKSGELLDWKNWEWDGDNLLSPTEEIKGDFPRRQKLPGKTFGLSLLLNPDLNEYFCTTSDSHGFRLLAHSPIEVPRVLDFGKAIPPNSEAFINVKPHITVADEKVQGFDLEARQCYFSEEFNLTFYAYYTTTNCLMECVANLTFDECSCVAYYMPRDSSRDLCTRSQYRCATEIKKKMVMQGYNKFCKQCLPSCTEIKFTTEITSVPLQQNPNIWEDGVFNKPRWSRSNVSIVHIYFREESTTAKLRTELYGFTDLFANFGGLMGLCLGFSGLSVIEIFYFLTIRAFFRRRMEADAMETMHHTDNAHAKENEHGKNGHHVGGQRHG